MKTKVGIVAVAMAASAAVAAGSLMREDEGPAEQGAADAETAKQLRESFFGLDYEAGVVLGRKHSREAAGARRLARGTP